MVLLEHKHDSQTAGQLEQAAEKCYFDEYCQNGAAGVNPTLQLLQYDADDDWIYNNDYSSHRDIGGFLISRSLGRSLVFCAVDLGRRDRNNNVDYDNRCRVDHESLPIFIDLLAHCEVDSQEKLVNNEDVYVFKHDWQVHTVLDHTVLLRRGRNKMILKESGAEVDQPHT